MVIKDEKQNKLIETESGTEVEFGIEGPTVTQEDVDFKKAKVDTEKFISEIGKAGDALVIDEQITDLDSSTKATKDVIIEGLKTETEAADKITEIEEKGIEERKEFKEEKIVAEKEFAIASIQRQEDLQTTVVGIEKDIQTQAQATKDRQVSILESQRATSLNEANAALQLQAHDDQVALDEATRQNDIARQQANVAFARYGLTFSTVAINTAQSIHSRGATRIAGLKLQSNYNLAKNRIAVEQIETDYNIAINDTIVKTGAQVNESKIRVAEDIFKIQNNILLTEKQKKDNIVKAKENYINNIERLRQNSLNEMRKTADRTIALTEKQQAIYEKDKIKAQVDFNNNVLTGEWFNMTDAQKTDFTNRIGKTASQLDKEINHTISSNILKSFQNVLGSEFNVTNMNELVAQVIERSKNGESLESALTNVTNKAIKASPEFKRVEAERELATEKADLELRFSKAKIRKTEAEIRKINKAAIATTTKKTELEKAKEKEEVKEEIGEIRRVKKEKALNSEITNDVLSSFTTPEATETAINNIINNLSGKIDNKLLTEEDVANSIKEKIGEFSDDLEEGDLYIEKGIIKKVVKGFFTFIDEELFDLDDL